MNKLEFTIGPAVAKEIGFPELERHLQHLVSLFRERSNKILPLKVLHPPQAHHLILLSQKLEAVEGCQGFDQHLRLYQQRPEAALFVASLAGLVVSRGGVVTFEPTTTNGRKADLAVTLGSDEAIVECKAPMEGALLKARSEHVRMFDVLAEYVEHHYHLRINYRRSLDLSEIEELGRIIKDRLPHVTEDGVIFASPELEVSVHRGVDRAPKGIHFILSMSGSQPPDNAVLPGHAIVRGGKNLAFNGPVIDSTRLLRDRIRKARKQAPLDRPFVVAISKRLLFGDPHSNLAAVQSEFTPKKYRHITGVLFAEFNWSFGGKEDVRLEYIPNSFASFPLPRRLHDMLRSQG
jgi:hypothetical protein